MLKGPVRIVRHLTSYHFFDEQVFQDRHFKSVEDGAFMRFDEWFWIADYWERGFRGLGQVFQDLLAARHQPFGDVDRKDKASRLFDELREMKNAEGGFLKPCAPLGMRLTLDLSWYLTEAGILSPEGLL